MQFLNINQELIMIYDELEKFHKLMSKRGTRGRATNYLYEMSEKD